jgi:osmotically-inducible protein OsmY
MASRWKAGLFAGILATMLALMAACSSAPRRSPEQVKADAATTDRIYAALNGNPVYFFEHVNVSVDDGVARLTGIVWTTDALYEAQLIASRVPGVIRVRDQIELDRAAARGGGDSAGE